MKVALRILILSVVVMSLMTSCITAMIMSEVEGTRYKSYPYSTSLKNGYLKKDGAFFVAMSSDDFQWNREAELAIKEVFTSKGVKCDILSDYYVFGESEDGSALIDDFMKNNTIDYVVLCEISDLYTYEKGNGVAVLEMNYYILDSDGTKHVLVSISTNAEGNEFESFVETRGKALRNSAKALFSEIEKYQ